MDWMQAFAIIGSLGAFTFWLFTKLDNDIKSTNARHDAQMIRIDQLYQMFVDLLKEKK
jgi:hypothetical protein